MRRPWDERATRAAPPEPESKKGEPPGPHLVLPTPRNPATALLGRAVTPGPLVRHASRSVAAESAAVPVHVLSTLLLDRGHAVCLDGLDGL